MNTTTVLILEDDLDLKAELTELLVEHGYAVAAFQNGTDALEYLTHAELPAVILLDLMMPQMNGWEFFGFIKKHAVFETIPVVTMSHGTQLERAPVSNAYLEKPLSRRNILQTVQRFARSA